MKYATLTMAVLLVFICTSCDQGETAALITTGSDAATSAGLIIAKGKLGAPVYTQLVAGLAAADTAAIAALKAANATTTLQDIFKLAMITDPMLAQYQAEVDFALPVLANVPEIQNALTTTLDKLSANAKAYAIAFFQGQLDACQGKNLVKDPVANLQKLAKDRGLTFNTDALAAKFDTFAKQVPPEVKPAK